MMGATVGVIPSPIGSTENVRLLSEMISIKVDAKLDIRRCCLRRFANIRAQSSLYYFAS